MPHCDAQRAPAGAPNHADRSCNQRAPVLARSPGDGGMLGAPCPIMITLIWLGIMFLVVIAIGAFVGLAQRSRTGHAQQ
jgi:hypothetical protein